MHAIKLCRRLLSPAPEFHPRISLAGAGEGRGRENSAQRGARTRFPRRGGIWHSRKTSQSCATEQAVPWVKPPTEAGFEYRQCYKPRCRCMKGGAWHGPYQYRKERRGAEVHSEYLGREV